MATIMRRNALPVVVMGMVVVVVMMMVFGMAMAGSGERNVSSSSCSSSVADGAVAGRAVKGSAEYLELFVEETSWYNDLVLGLWLPSSVRMRMPHILETWLRNYVAGIIVYFASGGLWCLYIYKWKKDFFFPAGWSVGCLPYFVFPSFCFFLSMLLFKSCHSYVGRRLYGWIEPRIDLLFFRRQFPIY